MRRLQRTVGAVGALASVGALIAVGSVAYAFRTPQQRDLGNEPSSIWLASPDHREIDKVNGLVDAPSRASADTYQTGSSGPIMLVRMRDKVIIVELASRRATTVDDATLDSTWATPPAGASLTTDGSTLYAVQPDGTEIIPVDSTTMATNAQPIPVDPVQAWLTAAGALWVRGSRGVDEIQGTRRRHIDIPAPRALATSRDGVAAFDGDGRTVRFLHDGRVRRTIRFPVDLTLADPAGFASAPESDTVAILDRAGRLCFFDPDRSAVRGAHDLGPTDTSQPFLSGDHAYVAHGGELLDADLISATTAVTPVVVSQNATQVELFQTDGFLWANANGPDAVAIHDGRIHHLVKYSDATPIARPSNSPPSPPPSTVAPSPTKTNDAPSRSPTSKRPSSSARPRPTTSVGGSTPPAGGGTISSPPTNTSCRNHKVHIAVPHANQTGASPKVAVHICIQPPPHAQYWIVDQAEDGGRWFAKLNVSANDTYTVHLLAGAEAGSKRTFYVVEADTSADIEWLKDLAAHDDGDGAELPSSITPVSNGVLTTR